MSPASPLEAIFFAALQKSSPGERAAYLDEACAGDRDLRGRVEKMLTAQAQAGSFLEVPAGELDKTIDQPPLDRPGTQIGPYKLLQEIGQGGMGVVYLAEQQEPVERRVALKIIKPGMDTRQVIARFEAERQALALMDHPNIAKVLDAGTTDSGRLYFVMELVNGIPVTQFCDEQHFTARERLQLFIPICQAVQHAHQKGIIHRDIKPSNILISLYDGRPVPKVIDFGVAKAVSRKLTEKTMFTGLGQIVGTIEYMSPEQAQRNQLDIDTRSDVYSLGVVLYELLTGDTPFDKQRLRSAAIDELLRIIREEEPPRPSTKLSSSDSLPSVAANRKIEPAKLSALVRGELDWIVMKALEKDRARRYETASSLAADITHYLNDEPVAARPASAAYRFRKFARRNKVALVTAALVTAALLTGTLVSTWQAVRATRAEQTAEARLLAEKQARSEAVAARRAEARQRIAAEKAAQAAETAQQREQTLREEVEQQRGLAEANFQQARSAVDQMLTEVADQQLADVPQMEPVRRALLEKASTFYEGFLAQMGNDPTVRQAAAQAHKRVGDVARLLGRYEQAEKELRVAIRLSEELQRSFPDELENQHEWTESQHGLGHVLTNLGRLNDAESAYRQALGVQELVVAKSPNVAKYRFLLAKIYGSLGLIQRDAGRFVESEKSQREAMKAASRLVRDAPTVPEYQSCLASCQSDLSFLLWTMGRHGEAEVSVREAMKILTKLTQDSPHVPEWRMDLATSHMRMANVLASTARETDAEGEERQALREYQRLMTDFPMVPRYRGGAATSHYNLGLSLKRMGRHDEAVDSYRQAIAVLEPIIRDFPGIPFWRYISAAALNNLANAQGKLGRHDEAEKLLRDALNIAQQLAEEYPDNADYRGTLFEIRRGLGDILWNSGRYEDAEEVYQAACATAEQLVRDFPQVAEYLGNVLRASGRLAEAHLKGGRVQEAKNLLRKALEAAGPHWADMTPHPTPPDVRWICCVQVALLHLAAGDADGYRLWCAELVKRYAASDDPQMPRWLPYLCTLAPLDSGDLQRVLAVAERVAADMPNDGWARRVLGYVLYRAGRFDESARLQLGGKNLEKVDANGSIWLAMTFHHLERAEEARQCFERAKALMEQHAQDNPGAAFDNLHLQLLYEEAAALLQTQPTKLADLSAPAAAQAHFSRGRVRAEDGQFDEAARELSDAIRLGLETADCYYYRACAYLKTGHTDQALGDLRNAVRRDWRYTEPYLTLVGPAIADTSKLDQVLSDFRELSRSPSDIARVWLKWASCSIPTVIPDAAKSPGTVWVSNMPWVGSSCGFGSLDALRHVKPWGKSLAGLPYANGIGTHAFADSTPADVVLDITGQGLSTFKAQVGLLDRGSAQFQVLVDGQVKHESPIMRFSAIHDIAVDVAGANQVVLRVLNGGDGNTCDSVGWGYARFIPAGTEDPLEEPPARLQSTTDVSAAFLAAEVHWRLDHKEVARRWFDKAAEWMEVNKNQDEKLREYRAEAAQFLGIGEQPPTD